MTKIYKRDVQQDDMNPYFSGEILWGNDFNEIQIEKWFRDEAEGYFNLAYRDGEPYSYGYHALNMRHGYSKLPQRRFKQVVGLGAAHGAELEPVLSNCESVTILEPSDGYQSTSLNGVPVSYEKPLPSGAMPFSSNSVDLITCLGVLHHIPNVGKVIDEIFRVLMPGGYVLLREPIISMGDWRKPRVGLTKRERGIPLMILREMVKSSGFNVKSERKCVFSLTSRLRYFTNDFVFNNPFIVIFDQYLCALPIWSGKYHPRNILQKLCPTAVYFVLQKPYDTDSNT